MGIASAIAWALLGSLISCGGFVAFDRHAKEPELRFTDHFDVPLVRFDAATSKWTTLGLPPEQPLAMVGLAGGGALLLGEHRIWRTDDGERFTDAGSLAGAPVDDAYALPSGDALLRADHLDRVWSTDGSLRTLEGESPNAGVVCVDLDGTVHLFTWQRHLLLARPWAAWAQQPDPGQATGCGVLGDRVVRLDETAKAQAVSVLERDGGTAPFPGLDPLTGRGARQLSVPAGFFDIGIGQGELVRNDGRVERFSFTGGGAPLLAVLGDEGVLDVSDRSGVGQWDSWLIDGTRVKQLGAPAPLRHRASLAGLGKGRALLGGGVSSETKPNLDAFWLELAFIGAAICVVSLCFFVLRRARGAALVAFAFVLALGLAVAAFGASVVVEGLGIHLG